MKDKLALWKAAKKSLQCDPSNSTSSSNKKLNTREQPLSYNQIKKKKQQKKTEEKKALLFLAAT